MAIKGTQVPTYTNTHCFCIILLLLFKKKKKTEKMRKIQKQCVFVYISTCIPLMAIEMKFLNFVSLVV